MARILLTGDWQAQVSNLDMCERATVRMGELVKKHKYDTIVHCGDLKEAFNPVDQRVTNFWVHWVRRFVEMDCKVIVLAGNHDRITTRDDSPSMLPVLREAGASTIDEPRHLCLGDGTRIAGVPHFRNPQDTLEALRKLPAAELLLFHCDVSGAVLDCTGRKMPDGISKKDLLGFSSKFPTMIGGHVHKHQSLGPYAWYVGSPFCCDWGEANQKKFFLALCIDSGSPTRMQAHDTGLPGWHDPELPNYSAPASWEGVRVRVRLRSKETPAEARFRAQQAYPGASIYVIRPESELPEAQKVSAVQEEQALREWINNNPPPVGTAQEAEALVRRVLDLRDNGTATLSFGDLEAQNVLSYQSVRYHVSPGQQLVLITGESKDWEGRSNGSGKTNLLSMVPIALFGRTLKGQQHDAWSRDHDRKARVDLELTVGAYPIRVERTRNPGGLRVWMDGVEHTQGTPAQTQQYLERALGLSFEAFCNAVYIGQQQVATILTGRESERKELLGSFLGLSRFGKAVDALKAILKRGKLFYATLAAEAEEASARCSELQARLADLPQETPKEMANLAYQAVNAERIAIEACAAAEEKRRTLACDVERVRDALMEAQRKYRGAEREEERLQSRLCDLEKAQCSECGSTLTPNKVEIKKAKDALAAAHDNCAKLLAAARALEAEFQEADRKQATHVTETKALPIKQAQASMYLETLREKTTLVARAEEVRTRLAKLEKFCRTAMLTKEVGVEWEARMVYCVAALSRDGFPAYLISRALPVLNAAARKYAQRFSGGAIGITFTQDDDSLTVNVNNPNGGDTLQDLSAGELQTAGLLATFALREALLPGCDLLMLDEPGNGLDTANASNFARELSSIAKDFGTVYVVSHNPAIIANLEADRRMHVTKQDGVSTLATQ